MHQMQKQILHLLHNNRVEEWMLSQPAVCAVIIPNAANAQTTPDVFLHSAPAATNAVHRSSNSHAENLLLSVDNTPDADALRQDNTPDADTHTSTAPTAAAEQQLLRRPLWLMTQVRDGSTQHQCT
jgi:hypothetical protein